MSCHYKQENLIFLGKKERNEDLQEGNAMTNSSFSNKIGDSSFTLSFTLDLD